MKKHAALMVLPGLLALQGAFAQAGTHLKLSDGMPRAGEKISFSYDPAGTVIAGKTIACEVHFLDGKDYPVDDVTLKADGGLMKGVFTIPATAGAFFIKMSADTAIDSNGEKGYMYMVYNGTQPVEGAYAQEGYVINSGMGQAFAKIKMDKDAAFELYKKEFELYPNNDKDVMAYVAMLNQSKEPAKVAKAKQLVASQAQTGVEKNMIAARAFYMRNKMTGAADSLTTIIKAKYPEGTLAQDEAATAFRLEKDPAKKEDLYQAYIKKYPEANEKQTVQDNMRLQLAAAYLQKGDMENYHRFESQLKDKTVLFPVLNNTAYDWAKKGERLDEAAALSKQSLELITQKMNSGGIPFYSASGVKKRYQLNYDINADTYAFILYKQGKYAEALKFEQPLYEIEKRHGDEVTEHYALMLKATGNNKKAVELIETAVKNGTGTPDMVPALKEMYVKDKGTDKGYDTYFAALKNTSEQKIRADLAKEMINQAAPAFALKDLDGNTVSLASLKGKIVIVDFWATWCGPCKASFPGMQLAVTKFKDNPNVKFVFVDTWETADNYIVGVKQFIANNKYTFHVLMDEKGEDGRQSKVVSAFGVDGIPTKFIIDVNGNIRFKKVGFEGSAEALADEVSTMIDMTLHPETVTTGGKVSINLKD